ncbi:hypothetical protein Esti_004795 [Eimeria stiedai]
MKFAAGSGREADCTQRRRTGGCRQRTSGLGSRRWLARLRRCSTVMRTARVALGDGGCGIGSAASDGLPFGSLLPVSCRPAESLGGGTGGGSNTRAGEARLESKGWKACWARPGKTQCGGRGEGVVSHFAFVAEVGEACRVSRAADEMGGKGRRKVGFVGMFVGIRYLDMARPLVELAKKSVPFVLGAEHTISTRKLNASWCDSLGAVLLQAGQPLAFICKKKNAAQVKNHFLAGSIGTNHGVAEVAAPTAASGIYRLKTSLRMLLLTSRSRRLPTQDLPASLQFHPY